MFCGTIVLISMLFSLSSLKKDFEFGEKIGIFEIEGIISDALSAIQDLKRFREDEQIKAIVIRIDSPGGGAGPSQEIFREVQKTAKVKKVIVSMGSLAASGGYYIAAGADGIVASPATITGSIGVIMGFTNIEELLDKIGLKAVVVKSGDYKDIGSPTREMTPGEKEMLQAFVDDIHSQFISDVAKGRNLPVETVKEFADGRIITGQQAKKLKLVDRLGNFEDAVEWAGSLSGIEGKISIIYARPKKFSFFEQISGSSLDEIISKISAKILIQYGGYIFNPSK
jgi:protease-4